MFNGCFLCCLNKSIQKCFKNCPQVCFVVPRLLLLHFCLWISMLSEVNGTKGLLYFYCEGKTCAFFAWCHPIGRNHEQVQANYCPPSPNRQAISRESSFDSPGTVQNEPNSFPYHVHRIEQDIRQMKTFMMISVAVAFLLILIGIFR